MHDYIIITYLESLLHQSIKKKIPAYFSFLSTSKESYLWK